MWNLETQEEVATLPRHQGSVRSVSYSPDGKTLASGGYDGTLKVWNLETQEEVATLPGDQGGSTVSVIVRMERLWLLGVGTELSSCGMWT
ncbi:hypothetical protein PMG25_04845 [Roseofilum sp. BLCC_M114]|uniref:WD40 repeat domain-containing protein n=1 Tax=Roseofilum capinflatum BLCC-M114 TaxID=3022440 RepID=A0ABT7B2L6_9CYAN|nr:hypothetical protein [Roseofilum capinflatum]MDJ1173414.1 hypothetical protein [Roseofilum capinflatum BLCC-M114]